MSSKAIERWLELHGKLPFPFPDRRSVTAQLLPNERTPLGPIQILYPITQRDPKPEK